MRKYLSWDLTPLSELIEKYAGAYEPWLVEELISDSMNSLASEPKLGKSAFVIGLSVAVANGDSEWLGRKVYGHGHVLFFLTDAAAEREYTKRLQAHDADVSKFTLADGRKLATGTDVEWNENVDALCELIPDLRLVVIDNLLGVLGDSGPGERLNTFWTRLQRFNDHDVTVIVLQHTAVQNETGFGKGNRPQGGRSNETSARQVIVFMPLPKSQPRHVFRVEVVGTDMPSPQTWYAEKVGITKNIPRIVASDYTPPKDAGKRERSKTPKRTDNERELLDKMTSRDRWESQREIAKVLGISQSRVSRILGDHKHQLQRDGKEGGPVVPILEIAA